MQIDKILASTPLFSFSFATRKKENKGSVADANIREQKFFLGFLRNRRQLRNNAQKIIFDFLEKCEHREVFYQTLLRQNTYVSPSAQPVQNRIDGRSKKEPHNGEEKIPCR